MITISSPSDSMVSSSSYPIEQETEDDLYHNAILLQKLVKGKSIQAMILKDFSTDRGRIDKLVEANRNRIPIINELIPCHENFGDEKYLEILTDTQKLDNFLEFGSTREVSSLISTLEKELEKLQDARNSQALYMLAEQERYARDSNLSLCTPASFTAEDRIPESVEISFYLLNTLIEKIDDETEQEKVRKQIKDLVRKIDYEADQTQADENEMGKEQNIATMMIDEILLPEVYKRTARENIRHSQKMLLCEAHESIYQGEREDLSKIEEADEEEEAENDEKEMIVRDILDEIIDQIFGVDEGEEDNSTTGADDLLADDYAISGTDDEEFNRFYDDSKEQIVNDVVKDIINGTFNCNDE